MKTKAAFMAYLRETLIPDLRESGRDFTADDFETCLRHMGGPGQPQLTPKEWTEVYYAVEYKAQLMAEGAYGTSNEGDGVNVQSWRRQLLGICAKIRKLIAV